MVNTNIKAGTFLLDLMNANHLTVQDLSKVLKVSNSKVLKWTMGTATPSQSKLKQLSKIFNVSFDELLLGQFINDNQYVPRSMVVDENSLKAALKNVKKKNTSIQAGVCIGTTLLVAFITFMIIVFVIAVDPSFNNSKVTLNETSVITYNDHTYKPMPEYFIMDEISYAYTVDATLSTNSLEDKITIEVFENQPFFIRLTYGLDNEQYFVRDDVDLNKLDFKTENIKYIIFEDDNEFDEKHYQEVITDKDKINEFLSIFEKGQVINEDDSAFGMVEGELVYYVTFVYENYCVTYTAGEVCVDKGNNYTYYHYDSGLTYKYDNKK